jgi:hypothetical protein
MSIKRASNSNKKYILNYITKEIKKLLEVCQDITLTTEFEQDEDIQGKLSRSIIKRITIEINEDKYKEIGNSAGIEPREE